MRHVHTIIYCPFDATEGIYFPVASESFSERPVNWAYWTFFRRQELLYRYNGIMVYAIATVSECDVVDVKFHGIPFLVEQVHNLESYAITAVREYIRDCFENDSQQRQ